MTNHNDGTEISTRRCRPWRLIYYEAFRSEKDAREREVKLKHHGNAIIELKKRIQRSFQNGGVLPRTIRNGAGFTLIELLVTISIIGILFGLGVAKYNEFNRRQILDQAAYNLKNNLRLGQSKALAGEKPSGCSGTLNGYQVSFSLNGYTLSAVCDSPVLVGSYPLPANIIFTPIPSPVLFKVLAQGVASAVNITLSGYGERTITITITGKIE